MNYFNRYHLKINFLCPNLLEIRWYQIVTHISVSYLFFIHDLGFVYDKDRSLTSTHIVRLIFERYLILCKSVCPNREYNRRLLDLLFQELTFCFLTSANDQETYVEMHTIRVRYVLLFSVCKCSIFPYHLILYFVTKRLMEKLKQISFCSFWWLVVSLTVFYASQFHCILHLTESSL